MVTAQRIPSPAVKAIFWSQWAYWPLELLGFPRLSAMWIQMVGWSTFDLQMLRLMLQSR